MGNLHDSLRILPSGQGGLIRSPLFSVVRGAVALVVQSPGARLVLDKGLPGFFAGQVCGPAPLKLVLPYNGLEDSRYPVAVEDISHNSPS
jgi:hypothetical protein